ncbi:MAG: anaerobic ribonucleoside-triphosphate reductase activating protein [Fusobacteriaceae bacterium]|jgi:pyruvate formate lyase activating enzyme|nr:anaerobic ribonucleoside-triphosphate reductase activating protein [Fusobacteriaceae bacterium]
MKIYGLQKTSLLDYPEKLACTIFTGGCNFRCPYCHNASLVINIDDSNTITEENLLEFLEKRKKVLEAVCISGGEPLLQDEIIDFIRKIKSIGYMVKIDTNGSYPEKLQYLIENNLIDYIAMDIKNSLENYPDTVGIKNFDTKNIEKSIILIMKNYIPYEFRTTIVREFHTTNDFISIGNLIKSAKKYYLQAFKNSENTIATNLHGFSKNEMLEFKELIKNNFELMDIRGI